MSADWFGTLMASRLRAEAVLNEHNVYSRHDNTLVAEAILDAVAPQIAARERERIARDLEEWVDHPGCDIPDWHNGMIAAVEIVRTGPVSE